MKKVYLLKQKGIAGLSVLIGMLFLSLALPLSTKLVLKNQENRSHARVDENFGFENTQNCNKKCSGGYNYLSTKCVNNKVYVCQCDGQWSKEKKCATGLVCDVKGKRCIKKVESEVNYVCHVGDRRCQGENILEVCEGGDENSIGRWISKPCRYGCDKSVSKCKASCGIKIFFSKNKIENPPNSVLCNLGEVINLESEAHIDGSINDWSWDCVGKNLVTAKNCKARRAVYCEDKGGECIVSKKACEESYFGEVINGVDNCNDMICCKLDVKIPVDKIYLNYVGKMTVGKENKVTATIKPENSTDSLNWRIDNGTVRLENNTVAWVKPNTKGKVIIYVTASSGKSIIKEIEAVNESDVCSNKGCRFCLTSESCKENTDCFWKKNKCDFLKNIDNEICSQKPNENFCLKGVYYECRSGRLRLWSNDKQECFDEYGTCNSDTGGKVKCNGLSREQCFYSQNRWSWNNLEDCEVGCKNGQCYYQIVLDVFINDVVSCEDYGGKCVADYISCESDKVISLNTSCSSYRPICCLVNRNNKTSGVVTLKNCKDEETLIERKNGEKICEHQEKKDIEKTCSNGEWVIKECNSICVGGRCL